MYMSCPHTFRENNFGRTFTFEMIVEYEHQQFELDFEVKDDEKTTDMNRHT